MSRRRSSTRAFSFADAMSMPITSSRSATHSVPPKLRSPFGAFSAVNQSAVTTDAIEPELRDAPLAVLLVRLSVDLRDEQVTGCLVEIRAFGRAHVLHDPAGFHRRRLRRRRRRGGGRLGGRGLLVGSGDPPHDASATATVKARNNSTHGVSSSRNVDPMIIRACSRSSSTRDDDARRSSSATGVVASPLVRARRASHAAFDAPNAATTTRPARASTGSVSVRRRAGGFGES